MDASRQKKMHLKQGYAWTQNQARLGEQVIVSWARVLQQLGVGSNIEAGLGISLRGSIPKS